MEEWWAGTRFGSWPKRPSLAPSEPIIELLDKVWTDVAALGDSLTDEQWQLPTDCPGWSVKDQVAHMIGTEMMLNGEDPPLADIGHTPHVRNDIGKFNEQWVTLYRNRTGAETLADFRRITGRRLDVLRSLPAAKWDEEGFTPEGPGPYRQFMAIRVFDCWYHDQDIREAVDRPGFLDGPVADLALERIPTKGLPYVVGKKAAAPQGSTIVFDIEGSHADGCGDRSRRPSCSAPGHAAGPDLDVAHGPPDVCPARRRPVVGRARPHRGNRGDLGRRRPRPAGRRQPRVHDLTAGNSFWKKKCRPPIGVSMVAPIST